MEDAERDPAFECLREQGCMRLDVLKREADEMLQAHAAGASDKSTTIGHDTYHTLPLHRGQLGAAIREIEELARMLARIFEHAEKGDVPAIRKVFEEFFEEEGSTDCLPDEVSGELLARVFGKEKNHGRS
jgi:hypothetical protein